MAGLSGMHSFILVAAICVTAAGGAAGWAPWHHRSSSVPSKCRHPADKGICRAFFPSYFFNTNIGGCDCFVYGGCQGNENRFDSLEECARECRVPLAAQVPTENCRNFFDEGDFGMQHDAPPPPPQTPQYPQHHIQPPPPAIHHPPLATHHPPLATLHPPLATEHPPLATEHPPLATEHPPLATEHPPLATHHPPLATHRPPLATHRPPLATHRPPLATHRPPLATHRPPLATYVPPLATHRPPLATHHLPHATAVIGGAGLATAHPVSFYTHKC